VETELTKFRNRAKDVPLDIETGFREEPGLLSVASTSEAAFAAPAAAAAAACAAAAMEVLAGAVGGLRFLIGLAHSWLALKSATAASVCFVTIFGTKDESSFRDLLRDKIRNTARSDSIPVAPA